ncbi:MULTISPECIES: GntR family transcriptional regulator [unclassified Mesorhizobium]|uniref:GntR family transcriptional regulator n=1 Tax=unclassified Mesorhizobium TaxID=325217 RepID=UPI00112EE753|nr:MULTISPECIES: GntR family transcriptional regulator [unclassified Mesorhizobium]MBZ9985431.1 GntR family transcriptional regulator [Mesorhizobium sp. BR-1-1-8]TPI51966.1 GntR family transcriptional regulator [Mesorhizobium sp. B3-1-1]TPJ53147.1 GntR family transcriptional regulator [Mesorhizobium sp. B2-6-4]TPJ63322.1 GntR family transcriptional regulator [Mesorhizobium sp. B2-6-7]TPJ83584.1 GntR family transcriptional regulator [Mesorhizobium sp. B2-6-3]
MSMIKTTLAEQAYQELRSRIVGGRLAGGQRLLPNELAAELGISPTPVKEACLRLEADGLLVNSSRRGMVVRSFNEEAVEELYAARTLLEKGAVEAAFDAGRLDEALRVKLQDSLENHRRFAKGSSLDDLAKALSHDRAFHSSLVGAAGIPMISEVHSRIVGQTHTVFVSIPGDYSRSVEEHQNILDAIIAGKKSQILAALQRHLERSRQNTLRQVKVLARAIEPNLV